MGSFVNIFTKVLKSKTLIVNWLTFAAGLITYLTNDALIAQHPEVVAILVSAVGIVNVVLRWTTVLPLDEKMSLNAKK